MVSMTAVVCKLYGK